MVLMGLEGVIAKHALHFEFLVTNNEAKCEALVTALQVARKLGVQDLKSYSNSQLVVRHIKGDYKVQEKNMMKYL